MKLAAQLGYSESPSYIKAGGFDALPEGELRYGCRKAEKKSGLQGVYLLRDKEGRNNVPAVFYCEAKTEAEARRIHREIWNLNLVPFIVVETPARVRVYQGFSYDADKSKEHHFVDASLSDAAEILDRLADFHADRIDDGTLFEKRTDKINTKRRVDEHLLDSIKRLDDRLDDMQLPRDARHCLIGKYVWLSYLKDRDILSDRRLAEKFGISKQDVFTRDAKLTAFYDLDEKLQGWLNGEIFPLRGEDRRAVKSEHLQKVAGVFVGDDPDGQLNFFTDYYDFSRIPIETLSIVYEQFLHHKEEDEETSEGEESGAYYTPVCLADFMIAEMDRKLRLQDGVAVFDPACGSGAFLVQAYRLLVERTMHEKGDELTLPELRALLKENIFGVDRDPDACRVARMSLAIALLDYAHPPDLMSSNFKLPALSKSNIRKADFFDLDPAWPRAKDNQPPQWIIGNPPWVKLNSTKREKDKRNKPAWDWLDQNKAKKKNAHPVSGNQVAEFFVWRVLDFARPESVIGLVMPAMTLFKHEAQEFRKSFFSKLGVWCVANFANLAYVLFAGRATRPAACFFYQPPRDGKHHGDSPIVSIAPLVADQNANHPAKAGQQLDTWNIVVRARDRQEIDLSEASKGERLTWKLALWGSYREALLLKRLTRFPTFETWRLAANLTIAAGPEIRKGPGKGLTLISDLIGKRKVSFEKLKGTRSFFRIPEECLSNPLSESDCYLRDRGGRKGLEVCEPPNLLINKGRRFAVFNDQFRVVPPGENGIHGKNAPLLKALAIYLISPVARWHQFFVSSEWGVSTSIARLDDLKALPIPFSNQNDAVVIHELAELYDALAQDEQNIFSKKDGLLSQAEKIIMRLLALRPAERDLIEGFFAGPWECINGKYPADAVDPAEPADVKRYCRSLRRVLDDHTAVLGVRHQITVTLDQRQVLLAIETQRAKEAIEPIIEEASQNKSDLLKRLSARLRRQHSQWVYFEKSLYFYEKGRMMFLKPRRRIDWNVRQAVLDADDLIAETLSDKD